MDNLIFLSTSWIQIIIIIIIIAFEKKLGITKFFTIFSVIQLVKKSNHSR